MAKTKTFDDQSPIVACFYPQKKRNTSCECFLNDMSIIHSAFPMFRGFFSAPDMIFPYLPFPGRQAQPERPRNAVGTSGVEQW